MVEIEKDEYGKILIEEYEPGTEFLIKEGDGKDFVVRSEEIKDLENPCVKCALEKYCDEKSNISCASWERDDFKELIFVRVD